LSSIVWYCIKTIVHIVNFFQHLVRPSGPSLAFTVCNLSVQLRFPCGWKCQTDWNDSSPKRPIDGDVRPYHGPYSITYSLTYFSVTNETYRFIARQHAMHAERDIVMANPSVRHTPVLYRNECTISSNSFRCLVGVWSWFFWALRRYNIPKGTLSLA